MTLSDAFWHLGYRLKESTRLGAGFLASTVCPLKLMEDHLRGGAEFSQADRGPSQTDGRPSQTNTWPR